MNVTTARVFVTRSTYFRGNRVDIRRSTVTPSMFVTEAISATYPRKALIDITNFITVESSDKFAIL